MLAWAAPGAGPIRFRNAADGAGVRFVLENHPTPEKHMIETMPGGVATLDYNNDGRTDIYFTNGAALPSMEKESPRYYNRLFRNDGGMKFSDVTEEAGVAGAGYSMGVAAGDYDNDGDVDLFVAGVFRNTLYRNRGDGTFEDVTEQAGIRSEVWAVAPGFFDYNNDGWLDLLVANYAEWSLEFDVVCGDPIQNLRVYCHPKYFQPLPNHLYRNRGDGTFEDVTVKAGLDKHRGRGMSVGFLDYDGDGWVDVFVTNDNLPNFLYRNLGDGRFEEAGLWAGVALLDHGKPVASMGTDVRDYDNDGLDDIVVTALASETFPLFRNAGDGSFVDVTYSSRMGPASVTRSGWGLGLVDFDNDGWKDFFSANSHANDRIEMFEAARYRQPNSVFANRGGTFSDVSEGAGADFQAPGNHRGNAFADFNGDGRIDIVVSALGEPAELWENVSVTDNHWLIVRLVGTKSNRDGIGARIRADGQYNLMNTAVGYASASHFGVHFGLGRQAVVKELEIRWPSGTVQRLREVAGDQVLTVREPER